MSPRDRRPKSDAELYAVRDIQAFIEKERRHDELDRFREVQEQRKVWRQTIFFCALLNLTLIGLAVMGMMSHG